MTFTYNLASANNVTRVRFHIGDTVAEGAFFSDEEIEFILVEEGSYQKAVIACIQSLIGKISAEPDFQADWLKVDRSKALAGYKLLLAEKRRALGVAAITSSSQPVYRGDSNQTEAPDW